MAVCMTLAAPQYDHEASFYGSQEGDAAHIPVYDHDATALQDHAGYSHHEDHHGVDYFVSNCNVVL